MGLRKLLGTPKQAKSTFKKIVKEEVDDRRNDRIAQQRVKKQGGKR